MLKKKEAKTKQNTQVSVSVSVEERALFDASYHNST